MSTFDFLSVLFSVVIGLALTEVLQGFRELLLARKRVTIYWPALLWGGLMIVVIAQAWWGMFAMRGLAEWNFVMYSAVIAQITLMYLAAGIVMPRLAEQGPVDMRTIYYANARSFFTLLAATVAATFLKDYVLGGHIDSLPNALPLIYYFTLSVIAATVRTPWFHWALPFLTGLGVVLNAALLSFRL